MRIFKNLRKGDLLFFWPTGRGPARNGLRMWEFIWTISASSMLSVMVHISSLDPIANK